MNKHVRKAEPKDLDYLFDTIKAVLAEQEVLYRFKYTKESFNEALFGIHPIAHFFILEIDGKYAGFANYSIDHRNFTANHLPNLYLNDLFIEKSFRRAGGATFLFDELKKIAKEQNCGRIEWLVQTENEAAIAFYKKTQNPKIVNSLHYMRLEL